MNNSRKTIGAILNGHPQSKKLMEDLKHQRLDESLQQIYVSCRTLLNNGVQPTKRNVLNRIDKEPWCTDAEWSGFVILIDTLRKEGEQYGIIPTEIAKKRADSMLYHDSAKRKGDK